tara:strand:- start:1325 stop:2014 length:690 start_codon:yes stop_codon:yes gene_type:complete
MKKNSISTIHLQSFNRSEWHNSIRSQARNVSEEEVILECNALKLDCKDIKYIIKEFNKLGLKIISINSSKTETIISASSLGFNTLLNIRPKIDLDIGTVSNENAYFDKDIKETKELLFKKGTLRSGEHLEAKKDILFVGDINPGAQISAGGDVLVWGRLLGIAHAGKFGNKKSKIVAMQLRPLQLRIANKIARGPKEKPIEGFAEEAIIINEEIVIQAATFSPIKQNQL